MADMHPDDLEKVDREIRINELKEKARELTEGKMHAMESEDAPPEILEAFWQNVVDIESAGWTSGRRQLQKDGVALPPPEELDDQEVTEKLWDVVRRLAEHSTFIYQTNHLSDRQLYEELWSETLNEEFPEMYEVSPTGVYVIDMLGSGSEEDIYLHMKYYADDEYRASWLEDFPDYEMPPKEKPPFDRDRHMPAPPHGW